MLRVLPFLFGLALSVRINEFVVRTNQYIRYFDDATPRFGSLPAWYQAEFDDSSWSSGPAPIGKCTGTTNLCSIMGSDSLGKSSIYLRKTVNISSLGSASLSITYDDSYIAYVNGQEVGRAYAGPVGYPMSSEQTAFWSNGATTVAVDITSKLTLGSNVIALQVNKATTASICVISAVLTVGGSTLIPTAGVWRYHPGLYEPSGGLIDHLYYTYEISTVGTTAQTPGGASSVPLDPTYHKEARLEYMTWLELHNDGSDVVFLGDWHLTNSPDRPFLYRIPLGLLNPGDTMIFVTSGSGNIYEYFHTNFEVSAYEGYFGLRDSNGTLVDEVTYGAENVSTWHSTGRDPTGAWVMYAAPTPGRPNTGATLSGVSPRPTVSPAAGMYSGAVQLGLSCPAGFTPWLTLNGEEPWPGRGNSTQYTAPWALGDGVWGIRARCFGTGYVGSPSVDTYYFINQNRGNISTSDITIVGLFSDPQKYFFGPNGITFISGGSGFGSSWVSGGPATYNMPMNRGQAFEVPAHFNLFKNNTQVIDTDMGMRISYSPYSRPRCIHSCGTNVDYGIVGLEGCNWQTLAATSGWVNKPSFNWYFRDVWSGKKLSYPIFDNGFQTVTQYKKIRFRAGKNDPNNPFVIDEWARRLFANTQPGTTGITTALVVNGLIRGYYNPIARLDEVFYQEWFCTPIAFDVAKIGVWEDGDPARYNQWLGNTSGTYNPATLSSFDIIDEFVDVENWADYILVNMFGCTNDWPTNNFVYYRGKTGGRLGKWKFGMWDAEFFNPANTNCWDARFPTGATAAIQGFYNRMRGNAEVRQVFQDRAFKLIASPDGSLTEQFVRQTFDNIYYPTDRLARWVHNRPPNTPYLSRTIVSSVTARTSGYLAELATQGYWQGSVLAPAFTQLGGVLVNTTSVTLSSTQSYVIYYCRDVISAIGTVLDPRLKYGVVNSQCTQSSTAVTFNFSQNSVIAARTKSGSQWSPVHIRQFELNQDLSGFRISEILYDDDSDSTEFLEFTNIGSTPIDIGGWQLWAGVYVYFAYGTVIQPGQYVCLVENEGSFIADYGANRCRVIGVFQFLGTLKNDGERLAMRTSDGRAVFDFRYDSLPPWPRKPVGLGYSLVWAGDVALAPGDWRYWRDSTYQHGSPGQADPQPVPPPAALPTPSPAPSPAPAPALICLDAQTRPCSTNGGSGSQTCVAGAWTRCVEATCNTGYSLVSGVCTLYGCVPGVRRDCVLPGGNGSGQQQCNASYAWSLCYPDTCAPGFSPQDLACVPAATCQPGQTQSCDLPTGTGLVSCSNGAWAASCLCTACNANFTCQGGQCLFIECSGAETRACTVAGLPAVETCSSGRYTNCSVLPHLCACTDTSSCASGDACTGSRCAATYCCSNSQECPAAVPLCLGGRCASASTGDNSLASTEPNPGARHALFL